jgi:SAM-dependent methyltransferase
LSRHFRVLAAVLAAFAAVTSTARGDGSFRAGVGMIDVMRERIFAHLGLEPGTVVADIGVGGGWFVLRVAEAVGPNGMVYGTDIDPGAITKLRQRLPDLSQSAGRVELRLCHGQRDTALDDLGDGRVDLILMIDSLCFDALEPRERNVAYLSRFLRILRPGGRLVHHMDCRCDVAPDAVVALFRDAGFSSNVEKLDVSPDPASIDAAWDCRSDAERARHAFVGIFRKSDSRPVEASPGAVRAGKSP